MNVGGTSASRRRSTLLGEPAAEEIHHHESRQERMGPRDLSKQCCQRKQEDDGDGRKSQSDQWHDGITTTFRLATHGDYFCRYPRICPTPFGTFVAKHMREELGW